MSRQSQLSEARESSSIIDSSLRKQYNYETEQSSLWNEIDNTVSKYYKSNRQHEQLTQNNSYQYRN